MINYQPVKILFDFGSLQIPSYGFALFSAFITGYILALREVKRRGLDVGEFNNLFILIVTGAVIGARIFFAVENLRYYLNSPMEIFKTWRGGVSSYGGFIGAFLFVFVYTKVRKINLWEYADAVVPSIALGIFITRIGCFLNWCDYGVACSLPWAVNAGDYPRHPTQGYLALNGLIHFLVFQQLKTRPLISGQLFLWFVISYNTARLAIEFTRDGPRYFTVLTSGQIAGLSMLLIGLVYLKKRKRLDQA